MRRVFAVSSPSFGHGHDPSCTRPQPQIGYLNWQWVWFLSFMCVFIFLTNVSATRYEPHGRGFRMWPQGRILAGWFSKKNSPLDSISFLNNVRRYRRSAAPENLKTDLTESMLGSTASVALGASQESLSPGVRNAQAHRDNSYYPRNHCHIFCYIDFFTQAARIFGFVAVCVNVTVWVCVPLGIKIWDAAENSRMLLYICIEICVCMYIDILV